MSVQRLCVDTPSGLPESSGMLPPMEQPFFIVGFPRSGTTLLQTMLMQLEGVCIPPETHFLLFTRSRRDLLGSLDSAAGYEATLRTIRHDICESNELPVDWTALEGELRGGDRTDAALMVVLLEHMRKRQPDCRRIGEKTPGYLLWAKYLLDSFKEAQVPTSDSVSAFELGHVFWKCNKPLSAALHIHHAFATQSAIAAQVPVASPIAAPAAPYRGMNAPRTAI